MKRFSLLFCAFICCSLMTSAQDVEPVQSTMVTKKTATWCTFCGTWGWSLFEGIEEDNSEDAFLVKAHFSGDLTNSTATEFVTNLSTSPGQPRFFLNRTDLLASNSNSAGKRNEIKNTVEANKAMVPVANAGIISSLDGNELDIQARAQFFTNTSGDFYMSILILEEEVEANQTSRGFVKHSRILRGAANSGTFGQSLINGDVTVDMDFVKTYQVTLDNSWNKDNLEIAAVIWEKVGNNYEFVNAFRTSELNTQITSTEELTQQWGIRVLSNISSQSATLQLQLEERLPEVSVELYDLGGQRISTLFNGQLLSGPHQFEVVRPAVGAAGLYLLRVRSGDQQVTEKIIFQ